MSFPTYKYTEIVKEEWETSEVKSLFESTKFMFVVFKKNIESDTESKLGDTYKVIKENGSFDVLHFGRRLLQSDKKAYKFFENDWQNNFKNSILNVDVEVIIRRIGEESYHE